MAKVKGSKELGELSAEMFELMGDHLCCEAFKVEQALEDALEELLSPGGGVMLVWWDRQHGLRITPALYSEGQ